MRIGGRLSRHHGNPGEEVAGIGRALEREPEREPIELLAKQHVQPPLRIRVETFAREEGRLRPQSVLEPVPVAARVRLVPLVHPRPHRRRGQRDSGGRLPGHRRHPADAPRTLHRLAGSVLRCGLAGRPSRRPLHRERARARGQGGPRGLLAVAGGGRRGRVGGPGALGRRGRERGRPREQRRRQQPGQSVGGAAADQATAEGEELGPGPRVGPSHGRPRARRRSRPRHRKPRLDVRPQRAALLRLQPSLLRKHGRVRQPQVSSRVVSLRLCRDHRPAQGQVVLSAMRLFDEQEAKEVKRGMRTLDDLRPVN